MLRIVMALAGFWLALAFALPPLLDEAYYFLWSRRLALGYFDHPPLVAVMAMAHRVAVDLPEVLRPGVSRLGTSLVALATLALSWRLSRRILVPREVAITAILLQFGNFLGLMSGVLTTPDSLLVFFWVLALSEAEMALSRNPKRWLSAGVAVGLGLMSKYTMALIGPVFLYALWQDQRRPLRQIWPYLGGVMALLLFSPNLYWNAKNDFVTFNFQLRHGLSIERSGVGQGEEALPLPVAASDDGPERLLARPFLGLIKKTESEDKKPGPYAELLAGLNRYLGFFGAQAAFWGLTLIAITRSFWRSKQPPPSALPHHALWRAAALVPLGFFSALSLFSKVEANWSAMYIPAASMLMAPWVTGRQRLLRAGVLGNAAIILLLAAHTHYPLLPIRPHKDRLLKETHGYRQLAESLAALNAPVFAETYQLAAMSRFWRPQLAVRQWPGITRYSELVANPDWADLSFGELRQEAAFYVLLQRPEIPRLPGFIPTELVAWRNCRDQGLQKIDAGQALEVNRRCLGLIHDWYLARYIPEL